jgi:hypothetical protein
METAFWAGSAAVVVLILGLLFWIDKAATVETSDFKVSCIDGVEYWYGQSGYKGYMSPRIDRATLDFVVCK